MNKNCEIIRDLLPQYHHGITSKASNEMIEKHLAECQECQDIWTEIKNGAGKHTPKKSTLQAGKVISAVLILTVLITFIVNIAVSKKLDWFFIVLTAILVFASVTVIPIERKEHRVFWTIISLAGSILLLLLSSCIYAGGDWFAMASVSTLFGISVMFMPVLLRQLPFDSTALKGRTGLFSMLADTLLLYATVITAIFYTDTQGHISQALLITTFCSMPVWLGFLLIRYTKLPVLTKAGILSVMAGMFAAFCNDVIRWINGDSFTAVIKQADFSSWAEINLDANLRAISLLVFTIIGVILILKGMKSKKN